MSDKQYGHDDARDYEPYFSLHLMAMTAEDLHSKGEIACELAYRDARIAELEAVAEKYRELLYQVACKFPNETRHETALRYLKERETPAMTADQCCEAILGGGENG